MTPTLHAIALLAILGGTIFACVRMRGPRRVVAGLVTALVCFFLSCLMPPHLCDAGHPIRHLLIGSACIVALMAVVKDRRLAIGLSMLVATATGSLAWNYVDLVHRNGVTGNPHPGEERRRIRAESGARQILAEMAPSDDKTYPAGWLHEAEFFRNAPDSSRLREIRSDQSRVEVRWLWHSWFTGLFESRRTTGALWFPGGRLSEAALRVEWRERPDY